MILAQKTSFLSMIRNVLFLVISKFQLIKFIIAFGSLKKFIFNQIKLPRRLTENKLIDFTVHPVI